MHLDLQATGENGLLLASLPSDLQPGWHAIVLRLAEESPVQLHAFLDHGHGRDPTQALFLERRGRGTTFFASFFNPRPARRLWLSGGSVLKPGAVRMANLRKMTTAERIAGLVRRGSSVLLRDPVTFFAKLPIGLRHFLKPPGLVQLNARRMARGRPSYRAWIANHEEDPLTQRESYKERLGAVRERCPLISVLMPVYNTDIAHLGEAIGSVREQFYGNWELCVVDDCSDGSTIAERIGEWMRTDPRIKFQRRSTNGHICAATNDAFAMSSGEWVALLDHDDVLRPHALAEAILAINAHDQCRVIYSDEDKITGAGQRMDPYFKPAFSPDLLRSQNYFNHLTLFERNLVEQVGGWRPGFEGSQDYDLVLRAVESAGPDAVCHIPKVLYHWRVAPGSTAGGADRKNYAHAAGLRALGEHLKRTGMPADALPAEGVPYYRVQPRLPDRPPLVSVIVATRNRVDLLETCVEGVLNATDYPAVELIVIDNNSDDSGTLTYLERLGEDDRVQVLRDENPFNFSALNNLGARHARGDILALVNNDIEVLDPGWMREMAAWASMDEVGCVGAKLFYPDGRIQHAGVVLGIGGVAGHGHKLCAPEETGYFGRLKIVHNVSAVTGACLFVRKAVYDAVGGLDERNLGVAFNDVDFCLRVQGAGYRNVWTPYAALRHWESMSRGVEDTEEKQRRFAGEVAHMKKRWGDVLDNDPFYSPHLTRSAEDFSYRQ